MNKLYHKLPFVLELFINGSFIFLYSFYKANRLETNFISPDIIELVFDIFKYACPIVIIIVTIGHYIQSKGSDQFIRKYVFSLICIFPILITYGDIQFTFWLCAVHLFSSVLSLYEAPLKVEERISLSDRKVSIPILEKIKLAPAQIVLLSFSGIILIGTLLLSLPISAVEGKTVGFVDAFFMATSATCVTGLATLSLADTFSISGQIIILILIQIGGLGYMTLYSSMTLLLGRSLGFKNQLMMQNHLDISSFSDLVNIIASIIRYTLIIELCGAIILTIAFSIQGMEFGEALYFGIFHSISAFCNAGFALFNNSMEDFAFSPMVHGTLSMLIFLGGLGFIVLKELELFVRQGKKLVNLSVHTKIVLTVNFSLIIFVALYIFFSEFLHGMVDNTLWEKIQLSVFQSITTRTAGFNTMSFSTLHTHTIYLISLIMFIGASPGSTGGGIKTTTFAILFQSIKATLRGRGKVQLFERTVPNLIVVRAMAITIISIIIVSFFILLMMRVEPEQDFLALFFETISAFATVGLSLGITPYLTAGGKITLAVLMLIGRVGPLTLAVAVGQKNEDLGKVEYPEGRIMIG